MQSTMNTTTIVTPDRPIEIPGQASTAMLARVPRDYLPAVNPQAVEQAMMIGDLSQMTPEVRIAYYVATCQSLGLNPLTRPFQALKTEDGQVLLYPDKGCAEQLRKRDRISLRIVSREIVDDLYIVTVEASTPDGRKEESEGIVIVMEAIGEWKEGKKRTGETYRYKEERLDAQGQPILKRLTGTQMANARMRCETKAKRRVTLAICGLGIPDVDTGHPMRFDLQQGTLTDDGAREIAAESSREHAKPQAAHIADLYGDAPQENGTPSPPLTLHPAWAQMQRWYEEADRADQFQDFTVWVCKRHKVTRLEDIAETELPDITAKVYATLEPLILARKMAATEASTPRGAREGEDVGHASFDYSESASRDRELAED